MRNFLILGIALTFLVGCASLPQTNVAEANEMIFKGKVVQLPDTWPSGEQLAALPMEEKVHGGAKSYLLIQDMGDFWYVFWFEGIEVNLDFTVYLLTQTKYIPGWGVVECHHWAVNPLRELTCEEFSEISKRLEETKSAS